MMQTFAVFADRSAAAKIRTTNFSSLSNAIGGCGLTRALARNYEPRNFLLKGWEATPRNFAPAKISHYTVYTVYTQ